MTERTIFFLSDFGTADVYAGVVEAVIASIAKDARVIHLTHQIAPQDLRNASWQLWSAVPHLPAGSIVLAVVDPGVGSSRRALCVEAQRLTYVAPDNGVLDAALALDPLKRAYAIEDPRFRLPMVSTTFHGRDVFGPAAAHLALGIEAHELGPRADDIVHLGLLPSGGKRGEIWTFDRFGNAITTLLTPAQAPRSAAIGSRVLPYASHYAAVEHGQALALPGSSGLVEISVRHGSARAQLELVEGDKVVLRDA